MPICLILLHHKIPAILLSNVFLMESTLMTTIILNLCSYPLDAFLDLHPFLEFFQIFIFFSFFFFLYFFFFFFYFTDIRLFLNLLDVRLFYKCSFSFFKNLAANTKA